MIKYLLFDTFGTLVDYRTSISRFLEEQANAKKDKGLAVAVDWLEFIGDWRKLYFAANAEAARVVVGDKAGFEGLDARMRQMLDVLVERYSLQGVWTEDELQRIALVWHRLDPWEDTVRGLHMLKDRLAIGPLSNGSFRLLLDLSKYGNLGFDFIFSSDVFQAYKPSKDVYLGACKFLQADPSEVGLVAAHLYDLQAAKSCGYKTVYIARPYEESSPDDPATAKYVDVHVQSLVDLVDKLEQAGLLKQQ